MIGWVSGHLRTFSQLLLLHKERLITVESQTICVGQGSDSALFASIYRNFSIEECDPDSFEKMQVCCVVISQPLLKCPWVWNFCVNMAWWTNGYWMISCQCLYLEIIRCGCWWVSIWYKMHVQSACWQSNREIHGLPGALSNGRNHSTHFLLFMLSIFSDFLLWQQPPPAEDFVGCARDLGTWYWIVIIFIGKDQGAKRQLCVSCPSNATLSAAMLESNYIQRVYLLLFVCFISVF